MITDKTPTVSIQIRHVGPETGPIMGNDTMTRVPMTAKRTIGRVSGTRIVNVRLGDWPSGVYFVQLNAPGGRVGYAPFVLRPKHLGVNRVAVVMPTQTWQAYNHRDDNGDGRADTWYACACQHSARLGRPFLDRGTPPHFKHYEAWWLRWLVHTDKKVDIISDAELKRASGHELAKAYSLIIFSGHHEYVTTHEYDAITDYRNRGGNLVFLSAHNGSVLSTGGIEADHTTSASPKSTRVVAEISNLYGPGMTAQMTYYETKAGAKVFAAGAFTLAGGMRDNPRVQQLVANLWTHLGNDRTGQ